MINTHIMKKFVRGGMLLILFKISLASIILLIQACQENVIPEDPIARFSSFLTSERPNIVAGLRNGNKSQSISSVDDNISESEAEILMIPTLI